jgi:hypothetical protein
MVVDLNVLEARVRRAYERGRALRALTRSAPLLAIGALVLLLDRRPVLVLGIDGLLFATAVLLLWRGQQAGRGMLAGLAAGAIPLLSGVCLQGYQLLCRAPVMMSGCFAVCSAGGLLAGGLIAWTAQRRGATSAFVLSAGTVALLMGTLGCVCAGVGGVVGLFWGLAVPIVARQLRAARQEV